MFGQTILTKTFTLFGAIAFGIAIYDAKSIPAWNAKSVASAVIRAEVISCDE